MLGNEVLPQPYRFINKLVQLCVDRALEDIVTNLNRGAVIDKKYIPPRLTPAYAVERDAFTAAYGGGAGANVGECAAAASSSAYAASSSITAKPNASGRHTDDDSDGDEASTASTAADLERNVLAAVRGVVTYDTTLALPSTTTARKNTLAALASSVAGPGTNASANTGNLGITGAGPGGAGGAARSGATPIRQLMLEAQQRERDEQRIRQALVQGPRYYDSAVTRVDLVASGVGGGGAHPALKVSASSVSFPTTIVGTAAGTVALYNTSTNSHWLTTPLLFGHPEDHAAAALAASGHHHHLGTGLGAAGKTASAANMAVGRAASRGPVSRSSSPSMVGGPSGAAGAAAVSAAASRQLAHLLPPASPCAIVAVHGGTPLHEHGLMLFAAATRQAGVVVFAADPDELPVQPPQFFRGNHHRKNNHPVVRSRSGGAGANNASSSRSAVDTSSATPSRGHGVASTVAGSVASGAAHAPAPPSLTAPRTPSTFEIIARVSQQEITQAITDYHAMRERLVAEGKFGSRFLQTTTGPDGRARGPTTPDGHGASLPPAAVPLHATSTSPTPPPAPGRATPAPSSAAAAAAAAHLLQQQQQAAALAAAAAAPTPLRPEQSYVSSVRLSPDGCFLAVGVDNDSAVLLFSLRESAVDVHHHMPAAAAAAAVYAGKTAAVPAAAQLHAGSLAADAAARRTSKISATAAVAAAAAMAAAATAAAPCIPVGDLVRHVTLLQVVPAPTHLTGPVPDDSLAAPRALAAFLAQEKPLPRGDAPFSLTAMPVLDSPRDAATRASTCVPLSKPSSAGKGPQATPRGGDGQQALSQGGAKEKGANNTPARTRNTPRGGASSASGGANVGPLGGAAGGVMNEGGSNGAAAVGAAAASSITAIPEPVLRSALTSYSHSLVIAWAGINAFTRVCLVDATSVTTVRAMAHHTHAWALALQEAHAPLHAEFRRALQAAGASLQTASAPTGKGAKGADRGGGGGAAGGADGSGGGGGKPPARGGAAADKGGNVPVLGAGGGAYGGQACGPMGFTPHVPQIIAQNIGLCLSSSGGCLPSSPQQQGTSPTAAGGGGVSTATAGTLQGGPSPPARPTPQHHQRLPSIVTCAAASPNYNLFAIGCEDGIVMVFDGRRKAFRFTFNEAPHRVASRAKHSMSTILTTFQGNETLTVATAVHGVAYRSFVTVYALVPEAAHRVESASSAGPQGGQGLAASASSSSLLGTATSNTAGSAPLSAHHRTHGLDAKALVAAPGPLEGLLSSFDADRRQALLAKARASTRGVQSFSPVRAREAAEMRGGALDRERFEGCAICKVPFLHQLTWAVPVGNLPFLLVRSGAEVFLVDVTEGELIGKLKLGGAFSAPKLPFHHRAPAAAGETPCGQEPLSPILTASLPLLSERAPTPLRSSRSPAAGAKRTGSIVAKPLASPPGSPDTGSKLTGRRKSLASPEMGAKRRQSGLPEASRSTTLAPTSASGAATAGGGAAGGALGALLQQQQHDAHRTGSALSAHKPSSRQSGRSFCAADGDPTGGILLARPNTVAAAVALALAVPQFAMMDGSLVVTTDNGRRFFTVDVSDVLAKVYPRLHNSLVIAATPQQAAAVFYALPHSQRFEGLEGHALAGVNAHLKHLAAAAPQWGVSGPLLGPGVGLLASPGPGSRLPTAATTNHPSALGVSFGGRGPTACPGSTSPSLVSATTPQRINGRVGPPLDTFSNTNSSHHGTTMTAMQHFPPPQQAALLPGTTFADAVEASIAAREASAAHRAGRAVRMWKNLNQLAGMPASPATSRKASKV